MNKTLKSDISCNNCISCTCESEKNLKKKLPEYVCKCGSEELDLFCFFGKPYRMECRTCNKKEVIFDIGDVLR